MPTPPSLGARSIGSVTYERMQDGRACLVQHERIALTSRPYISSITKNCQSQHLWGKTSKFPCKSGTGPGSFDLQCKSHVHGFFSHHFSCQSLTHMLTASAHPIAGPPSFVLHRINAKIIIKKWLSSCKAGVALE